MHLVQFVIPVGILIQRIFAAAPDIAHSLDTRVYSNCQNACTFLNGILKGKVSYPQSSIYIQESQYWSLQQASVVSVCRVSPTSAGDVSAALLVLELENCPFAVKSGGHAAFAGGSNIAGGITIDLVNLNEILVSSDKTQTSVGPGNRWSDVYSHLDPLGLSVIGGRVADIGVGGLTLGGGISFFSGRYGLACDNVNNYEVVFADGSIHNVNLQTYPDLYWALRGGGNNFGIVTRFDLVTFPQGDLWGGAIYWTYNNAATLLQALQDFNTNAPEDPYATLILAFVYQQSADLWLIASEMEYGKPIVNPPILQNFTNVPSIGGTMRISNLTGLTLEQKASTPSGFRETYWTATFKNNAALMTMIQEIFVEEITNINNVTGFVPACVFQAITTDIISHFGKNGGNALGITPEDGPLILFNTALMWNNTSDDARVMAAANNTISRANTAAKSMGLDFRYIYQNYASQNQKVFDSYGAENHERLRKISQKYDPLGVFERLQPGYFKV